MTCSKYTHISLVIILTLINLLFDNRSCSNGQCCVLFPANVVYGARNYSQESESEEALSASSQRESSTVLPVTSSTTDGLWSHGIR